MTQNVKHILEVLDQMFPNAHVELNHKNHFELLVAVVLSAQTTDISVNKVTPQLFLKFPTPKALSQASQDEVESLIKTIGLFRMKAKHIIALAIALEENYQGVIPNERQALESLPGVGRKTANVVLSNAFGIPALAVDTHVKRVSIRLGLADASDDVLEVEKKLMKAIPKYFWLKIHHQFIFFGRYHCLAKKPLCKQCSLFSICKYPQKSM